MNRYATRVGSALVHLTLDLWVAVACLVVWTVGLSLTIGLAITVVGGALALAGTLLAALAIGSFERARVRALLGTEIAPPNLAAELGPREDGLLVRGKRLLRSETAWRALGYTMIQSIFGFVTFSVVVAAWAGSVLLLLAAPIRPLLPKDRIDFGIGVIDRSSSALGVAGLGVLSLLVVAPLVTLALADIDRRLARRLLGPSANEALRTKVVEVSSRQRAALDAAEAERRRIERDLHDGAQQRLVSLGMTLGLAKEKLDSDPEKAKALIEEAHADAKSAMSELRTIARGIHPAVLTDRGLDAALSSVVARSPIPVSLTVHLPERAGVELEGAAYYVITEALTNAAKHSNATSATVEVYLAPPSATSPRGTLIAIVADDGFGDAQLVPGGGLAGLSDRVSALGGSFSVVSPVGGPTVVRAEFPR